MKIIKDKTRNFASILTTPSPSFLLSIATIILLTVVYIFSGMINRTAIPQNSAAAIMSYINNTNKEHVKNISPYITIEKKEDLKIIVMQYDTSHYQDSTFEIMGDTLLKLKKIYINNKVDSIIFNGNDISSLIIDNNSSEEYLKKVVAENEQNNENHQNILVIKLK